MSPPTSSSSSSHSTFIIIILCIVVMSIMLYKNSTISVSRDVNTILQQVASVENSNKLAVSTQTRHTASSLNSSDFSQNGGVAVTSSHRYHHRRHRSSSHDEQLRLTNLGRNTIKMRYEFMSKKSFAFSHKTFLKSPDYFAGWSYEVVNGKKIEKDSSSQQNEQEEEEVFRDPQTGFASVNWTKTMNCLKKVHKIYFSSTDDFSKLIPFTEANFIIITDKDSNDKGNNHINNQFQHFIRNNWDVISDTSSRLSDYGLRMRAFGFCLKGGGAGVQRMMTEGDWQKRGGSGTLTHPYMMALHGGVSPLRALVQGFRSAEYLGVPISREFLFGRNDASLFLSEKSDEESSKSSMKISFFFSPLILSSSSSSSSSFHFSKHADFIRSASIEENRRGDLSSSSSSSQPFVIVDLGGGHGSLLNAMCPPNSHIWCYGVDFAPKLIEQGSYFFPHLDLRHGVSAPHIPRGTVDALLSNAVMPMIKYLSNCVHLREVIRLLRPGGGIAQIWQPATYLFNRFHPSWFVEDEEGFLQSSTFSSSSSDSRHQSRHFSFIPDWDNNQIQIDPTTRANFRNDEGEDYEVDNDSTSVMKEKKQKRKSQSTFIDASKIVSRCPGGLGRFISRIELIADDPRLPIYTPRWTRSNVQKCSNCQAGTFGVRIFRNDVEYGDFDKVTPVFEPEQQFTENKGGASTMSYSPPLEGYSKTLKPPLGLLECFENEEKWKRCAELDAATIKKVFDCGDQLKKWYNPQTRSKVKGWCPEHHQELIDRVNAFRKK